ncbi:MAG: spore coat protein YlbD [Bacilli bacterium]
MNKLDEFKEFIKNHRYVFKLIETKKYTWQELYERYDIFGPDDKIFKEENNEAEEDSHSNKEEENERSSSKAKENTSNNIFDTIAGIDVDKISDGLNGMKKILNILNEVTKPEDQPIVTRRKMSKPYKRSDD